MKRILPAVLISLFVCFCLSAEAATEESVVSVTGFRSAHFGMDKKEVQSAILKDFGIREKEIRSEENPVEKTTSLVISVANLLPDSGNAIVVYILGYKSKKLIQVNVIWGKVADKSSSPEKLVATANLLRNYFAQLGFEKENVVMNQRMVDGSVLVFKGVDSQHRMTSLILIEKPLSEKDKKHVDITLQLSYIEKPESPDIFLINKGMF